MTGADHADNMFDLYAAILNTSRRRTRGLVRRARRPPVMRRTLAAPLQMMVTSIVYSEYVGGSRVGR